MSADCVDSRSSSVSLPPSINNQPHLENGFGDLVTKSACDEPPSCLTSTATGNGHGQPRAIVASNSLPRKAKRVKFFRNGDRFFGGITVPVTADRYRSFDKLTEDLTRILMDNVNLPHGVRVIYSLEGKKITSLDDLLDGGAYVCAGTKESFKMCQYLKIEKCRKNLNYQSLTTNSPLNGNLKESHCGPINGVAAACKPNGSSDCVRPRIVTLIRNGLKPRKIVRLLLNKRNSASMDQVLNALTEVVRLDSGAVRRVYTLAGSLVTSLEHFFLDDDVFFVYGNERMNPDDFELEYEESKFIQQYKKAPIQKISYGPKPKMPKKVTENGCNSDQNSVLSRLQSDTFTLPPNLKTSYVLGRVIGDGNFAVVRLCRNTLTGTQYAMKIIDKSRCKSRTDTSITPENEVRIMRKLNHPNIMMLILDYDTPPLLYLIVEYVKGGDLFDAISSIQKFSEKQAALMINHLISAIAYLHSLNIVHRDVKPENLLVEVDANYQINVLKLCDFGLACECTSLLYTVCGTPTYVAPEILSEIGYSFKIDVWAVGVILYILLCGFPPFFNAENDQEKLFTSILSGIYEFPDEYWYEISDEAKDLISNMLQHSVDLRFSAEDVLDHRWFSFFN